MNKPTRILVVDDDEELRKSFAAILEDEGYIVDGAGSGQEAIEKTTRTSYNLAILDIRLPDMEGVDLLTLMKESVPRMRKIMVTGYPSLKNTIAALNNRADFFFIKPVDIEILLAVVREQLSQQEREMQSCNPKEPEKTITLSVEDTIDVSELVKE